MRALKIISLGVCFSLSVLIHIQAQSLGDYRSVATGNWGTPSTWQYYNGSAWVASTTYPGQIAAINDVTLQSPFMVTVDINPASNGNQMNSLRVNNGATLKDNVGPLYYEISPAAQFVVDGTVNLANTTDVTARIYAGNCTISFTGNLTAHSLHMVTAFNFGIATITHDVVNLFAINPASNAGVWVNQTNSVFNFGGPSMTAALRASSSGNTMNYYSSTSNQSIRSPIDSYGNLTLSGTGGTTKSLSANTTVEGTLSIQGNSAFSLGVFDISVGGDWNSSSTGSSVFGTTTNVITFNGSNQQNIINTGNAFGIRFSSLTIANTSLISPQIKVNTNGVISIRSTLTMTSGNIDLGNNSILLGENYTNPSVLNHSGTSSSGWVYNGFFFRSLITNAAIANGSINGLFPVGTSTSFRPFYISTVAPSTSPSRISVLAPPTSTFADVSLTDGASIIRRQNRSGWLVSSFGDGMYNVRAGGTGLGIIGNVVDLRLSPATLVLGTAGTNSGTTTNPLVERTGLTIANLNTTFYVGSVNLVSSPLPVELISFSGEAEGSAVNLNWVTKSELNCDYFTVYRSINGIDFISIGNKKGAGTTKEQNKYDLQDTTPLNGTNYYRLEQTDWDGSKTIVSMISVQADGADPIQVFPNPIMNGNDLHVRLQGLLPLSQVEIHLVNMAGKTLKTHMVNVNPLGNFDGFIGIENLPKGVYGLKFNQITRKILIQ